MDMQDKRIRLPRIHNFGDDSMPVHAIATHNRSQYDNSEEDYSMSEIQQTAKKLQAKYEHSRGLKRNHFKEDIDTTDWDDIEPSFDDEPQVPKQSLNTLQKNSRDSLKAFLNGANVQSERKGAQNSSVRNRHLNLSEQKDPRTTADFANIAPGELHRSLLAIEEKGRANRAYYANKSHIVSNEGYGDSEPTIPIRILQDSLLEDSYASRTPPPFEISNTTTPAAFEHRNVENKRHELMVLPEIQEKEKSTQEFSTEATPKPSTHETIDDSKRYKSAPRNSRPARNFLIPLQETPAQEETEPKDHHHSLLTHKPEKAVTQRVIRRQKPAQKSPLELPAPIVQRQRKPGVPRFAHPEKKNSVAQAVNNSDIIGGEVEKVWPVNKREGTGTVRNLSEQKNPSSSIISQGDSNSRNKVIIKENRNASVEMGKVKKPTSENYMSDKVEYMFVLHDKSRTENELMQQNNLIKKQIVQFRDLLQNLADKADGKKKKLPPGKLGWLMEEVKASKQVYDNLQEEYKKLQTQTTKANNSDYLLTLEKEIQKVREAKKREEREKRNMELLDKKELYTNKGKASNRGHGSSEADTINRVNLMQEARDRLKRQHSKLREKNAKAQETRTEQDENLKKLEEKYSKLLGASQGPGQGWTGADILKFEEAKKRGEKVEELNKKISILNKAIAQQERYQEGVTEVLRKEAECEAKFLEQNTKELDRKQYALELLNMDIQKIVMESPIFNEIKGRSYDAEADDQQILKNLVTGVKTTERKTGENEDEENHLKQVLKDREIDFVIAEMKRREARKLTKQASSKESSRSPDSEKKSKERTPLKSQPESDYEEEDSLMEVDEKSHRRKNKVKEEVKKAKKKVDEPKPREPKPPVPKFTKPKKPEIKVTSPKEHKEKESRRTSMGSVVEPDSLDNSPVRQLTDKIKESLLEIEKKNNEVPVQANVVNENEEIKKEELRKKVEEALKSKYEVKTEVKVKTPKKAQEIKEDVKEVKPAKEVKEEVPLQVKKSQPVKEEVEKSKEIKGGKEEVKTVKEFKEELPVETKKSLEIKPKVAKIDKRESKEEVEEDIPEYKEFKPLQSGKETKREIKEENVFKEPEIIQKPKETKQIFEIQESIKEEDEEKSALTLKPQLFRSKKTDNNKPIGSPIDLKLKDNSTDMFSIKSNNNALPDSSKELIMPGSTNSRTLVLETNNAKRPLDRTSISNIPMTESKEVAMPGLLSDKIPQNTPDQVLPDKSPEKSSTVKDEPLELPIAITGVSRRNRFVQAPRAGMESKQESLEEKPVANQDNKLNLDFLKQSSQSPDPGKRAQADGLGFSANKDNINANQPLVSPFKAPEEKPIGRRRQISNIPEDKTPPKKDSLDDIFGFDSEPTKEEQEKDKNIFGKPGEKAVGFGLGFGLGMSDEPKKSIGGFGGGQISSINTGASSGGDDIARGAQARNRLARLKRGDDAKPVEEIASFNVENNKGSSILESGRKDITKTVDPFSKFDDISSLNIEAKGKDLFGNRDNKPMMFGKGEEKKDNRNDLGSFLDAQFESKQEESIGNARRMRMNQKDRSVNVKEKESALAVKAQQKENKFFGDIDLDDF